MKIPCFNSGEFRLVLLIILVLAFVLVPHVMEACKMAVAAQVVGDFNAVIGAATICYIDKEEYPPSGDWGVIPEDLSLGLPRAFSFNRKGVTYRWRRWCLPSGLPKKPDQTVLVGLQVRTKDPKLLGTIMNVYQGRVVQLTDNQVTFVIL